jgi:V-type H+-transporting ATPase subunit a
MASIFFPERMDYIEMVCPLQSAYFAIKEIAQNGHIQLLDVNVGARSQEKRYTETYLQCEEATRSLSFMKTQLELAKKLQKPLNIDEAFEIPCDVPLQEFVEEIQEADAQLREKTSIYDRLKEQLKQQREKLALLRYYIPLLDQAESEPGSEKSDFVRSENVELQSFASLPSCTGYVSNESMMRLQNMILRVTRRNAFMHFGESLTDVTPFVVFAASSVALQKVVQIAQSFSKNVYQFPTSQDEIQSLQFQLETEISQTKIVCDQAKQANIVYLDELAEKYWKWDARIVRESQIWSTIDFGDFSRDTSSVIYNGWMPRRFVEQLDTIAQTATQEAGSPVPIRVSHTPAEQMKVLQPPTFIETTTFQYPFQLLNDAYGVPSYNELNAGAFYQMYPFLFGIMFGDMGHALFYFLISIACFVIVPYCRKRGNNLFGMLDMVDNFKWFLLFASICAFYCGFLYNETFGLPINLFGTHWVKDESKSTPTTNRYMKKDNGVYPFGIDPTWLFKDNELIFLNSFKMKFSIVMGMSQMVFGIVLSFINRCVNKDWPNLIAHNIPEILYLVPFFGYLVIIIIKKWLTNFHDNLFYQPEQREDGVNLIQVMIGMILNFGSTDESLHLYDGQWGVQTVITMIFFVSIPLFLFAKPIFDFVLHRKEESFSLVEAFVMNLIHVIEFCLSALSHTASYLRLWALSLAHSQLSHVLWDELFLLGANLSPSISWLSIFFLFMVFAVMTVAILLGMEAFSALLHAIRLMWVEFSSKFYEGTGYEFKPVSLKTTLKEQGYY